MVREENGGCIGVLFGVKSVHALGTACSHKTGFDKNARIHKENGIAKAIIREIEAEVPLLTLRQEVPAGQWAQPLYNPLARSLVEKPEPGHGGVVEGKVVAGHFEFQ